MSLKAFHIVFVSCSTILAVGFGVWSLRAYDAAGGATDLWLGVGSLAGAAGLLIYGRYFLKKLKTISYL